MSVIGSAPDSPQTLSLNQLKELYIIILPLEDNLCRSGQRDV